MEKQTVENKVKEIAEAMGLTYLCESWFRANQAFDRFRRQGCLLYTSDAADEL